MTHQNTQSTLAPCTTSIDSLVRKLGGGGGAFPLCLRCFSAHNSSCAPGSPGPLEPGTHPVEGFMMQPPLSAAILQLQPLSRVSWFIPKLWPSSCAKVTAAPRGLSEWSSKETQEHRLTVHICLALSPPSSHSLAVSHH